MYTEKSLIDLLDFCMILINSKQAVVLYIDKPEYIFLSVPCFQQGFINMVKLWSVITS